LGAYADGGRRGRRLRTRVREQALARARKSAAGVFSARSIELPAARQRRAERTFFLLAGQ
jgi:hypothetical protein